MPKRLRLQPQFKLGQTVYKTETGEQVKIHHAKPLFNDVIYTLENGQEVSEMVLTDKLEEMPKPVIANITRERYENADAYAARLLASMFQEVYAHTGREMPSEMFDRAHDITTLLMEAVAEKYHVVYKA